MAASADVTFRGDDYSILTVNTGAHMGPVGLKLLAVSVTLGTFVSSGVTHTLIGVDSFRVFPFLASISGGSRSLFCLKGQGC